MNQLQWGDFKGETRLFAQTIREIQQDIIAHIVKYSLEEMLRGKQLKFWNELYGQVNWISVYYRSHLEIHNAF